MGGIYKITNMINNKFYIGSTTDFIRRKKQHFNKKCRYISLLKNALCKYGKENFKFEIIEEIIEKDLLFSREQYWLDFYKSYERDIGYNICKIAQGGGHGSKENTEKALKTKRIKGYNKETYPAISESKKGNKNPMFGINGLKSPRCKKLYCYNMDGTFYKEFDFIKQAQDELKVKRINLKNKSSYGYRFSLIKKDKLEPYIKYTKNE